MGQEVNQSTLLEDGKGIPVGVDFHPSWWYKNYGISFGEEYYLNPDARVSARQKMARFLYQRFGDLGLGDPDPHPSPFIEFGIVTIPALFGCPIKFFDDNYPWVQELQLSEKEICNLKIPDIEHTYPMTEIIRQMDYLENKYGRLEGDLNCQGVQNLAMKMRGEQLFLDYFDNPSLAYKLLHLMTQTMIQVASYVKKRTGSLAKTVTTRAEANLFVTSNCSVTMISNQLYEKYLLPYDNMLSQALQPFGIHHCGVMDDYLEGYAKVENLSFLEAGWGSSISKIRKYFPNIQLNTRISPVRLLTLSEEEIRQDVLELIRGGAPLDRFSISSVGVEYGTPDENIRTMFQTAWEGGILRRPVSHGRKHRYSLPIP